MRTRWSVVVALALVLVSSACSEPTRHEGTAAPDSSRAGGSLHDDVIVSSRPPASEGGGAGSSTTSRAPAPDHSGAGGVTPSTLRASGTTTTTPTTLPPGLPPEKCPDAKTCRRYVFETGKPVRYPAGPDGRVTIAYWINFAGLDTSTITLEEAEAAIAAAFQTWANAAPTLRFVYRGRTNHPVVTDDGWNVVGFQAATTVTHAGNPELDIEFTPSGWKWEPCEQRDNSCTPVTKPSGPVTTSQHDLQSIATHEAGHALGLGHPRNYETDREMTMYAADLDARSPSTLALGDVLGIRATYPCSCPLPPIYSP